MVSSQDSALHHRSSGSPPRPPVPAFQEVSLLIFQFRKRGSLAVKSDISSHRNRSLTPEGLLPAPYCSADRLIPLNWTLHEQTYLLPGRLCCCPVGSRAKKHDHPFKLNYVVSSAMYGTTAWRVLPEIRKTGSSFIDIAPPHANHRE